MEIREVCAQLQELQLWWVASQTSVGGPKRHLVTMWAAVTPASETQAVSL